MQVMHGLVMRISNGGFILYQVFGSLFPTKSCVRIKTLQKASFIFYLNCEHPQV